MKLYIFDPNGDLSISENLELFFVNGMYFTITRVNLYNSSFLYQCVVDTASVAALVSVEYYIAEAFSGEIFDITRTWSFSANDKFIVVGSNDGPFDWTTELEDAKDTAENATENGAPMAVAANLAAALITMLADAVLAASAPQITPICFAKGTIVSTDQGNMEIQNIVPGKHTIGEKAICHITKTISPEKKIVCVKKNAFGKNKPNKAITMSGNHCIQCEKGAMVKAKELVANNRNMKFVEYNQEPLYNVLMEDHNVIKVQNLEVETLDPENIVAKIHNSLMDKSILAKLVKQMNEGIRENNREKYLIAEETIRKG